MKNLIAASYGYILAYTRVEVEITYHTKPVADVEHPCEDITDRKSAISSKGLDLSSKLIFVQ